MANPMPPCLVCFFDVFYLHLDWILKVMGTGFFLLLLFAVTVVESGTRALQYLGLDGDHKSSIGLDVRKLNWL